MDVQVRRIKTNYLQDQENAYAIKGKGNIAVPTKQEMPVRGVLGELTNAQTRREIVGKVAVTTAEFEKKASLSRNNRNYGHIQSKVDTGLSGKSIIQPTARPPLRRQESTAGHATRAHAQTRVLKDTTSKPNEIKEVVNSILQAKKVQEKKSKLPSSKDTVKEKKALKPILKESTESLSKLKLAEITKSKSSLDNDDLNLSSPKLPDDIEDIDDKDNKNPILMTMYIKDIYRYLTRLEDKYAIRPDHLSDQCEITGKMRATLVDWLVEVQTQFSLLLETFHLTVGIIDRYLQMVPNVKRNRLQLVGVTAMFIASKYEEVYAPSVADFVFVTDNAYTKHDVFQCEREIMCKLGFCLARPIPLSFLRRFVKAAKGEARHHHLAKYFVDLCLVEYTTAHYKPSELAAAAMCLSRHLLTEEKLTSVWTRTMEYYSGYTLKQIEPIMRKIAKIVVNIDKSSYKAVPKKYSDRLLARVASFPQLKGDVIKELADIA